MPWMTPAEHRACEAYGQFVFGNPFLPERLEGERQILGRAFVASDRVWSLTADSEKSPNLPAIDQKAEVMVKDLRKRLPAASQPPTEEEVVLYVELGCYVLYCRNREPLLALAQAEMTAKDPSEVRLPRHVWERFLGDYRELFELGGRCLCPHSADHLFALCFQTRRAFFHVFHGLVGGSLPAANLRAEVWQSIFTHDRERFVNMLYDRMRDLSTLIIGESGTGKEIVAASIARSQYRAFNPKAAQFAPPGEFAPINLSALPSTLIESELFGHKRGSFTGATSDRRGWLDIVGPAGSVFLDEVGDITPEVQVKLLRVLQDRTFQCIGDTRPRHFVGKIIAATNRNLAADLESGQFRPDLYYRISGDLLRTPSLREQVQGDEQELRRLLLFVARRVVGNDVAAREALVAETLECIQTQLGLDYPWPGNFRELEQCVRNVLVRKRYAPANASRGGELTGALRAGSRAADDLPSAVAAGSLSADELLTRYTAHVHRRLGTYEAAARHLGIDRRTVKARVDSISRGSGAPRAS